MAFFQNSSSRSSPSLPRREQSKPIVSSSLALPTGWMDTLQRETKETASGLGSITMRIVLGQDPGLFGRWN